MRKKPPPYDLFSESAQSTVRFCEHKGCQEKGEFKAPKGPLQLQDYYWFCLDHVRDYNKSWDFYKGMTTDEIVASRISDVTWNRPSWPLGSWRAFLNSVEWEEGLDFLESKVSAAPSLPKEVEKALNTLELKLPLTVDSLKRQYKKLVKCHHPDLHAGDKKEEERLKLINTAYTTVKKYLQEMGPIKPIAS